MTGYWGEATSGGNFPFRLKGSGFDGIIITGRSEKPVYLRLQNGEAEIRDASELWARTVTRLRNASRPSWTMATPAWPASPGAARDRFDMPAS